MNVPHGWKLVPVEPTPAMTAAYAVAAEELTKRHLLSGSYPATWQPTEAGYVAMLAAAPTPPAQQDAEAHSAAVSHLYECLGRWSASIAPGGELADLAPPSWLIDAINAATLPRQDDEALEVLRRIISTWESPWPPGADPMAHVLAEARALLTKRGAA